MAMVVDSRAVIDLLNGQRENICDNALSIKAITLLRFHLLFSFFRVRQAGRVAYGERELRGLLVG